MPIRHLASVQCFGVSRASSRRGRIGALLLATLFAVLLGFFAMHGLAAHGVGHGNGSHSTIPGVAELVDEHEAAEGHEHGTTRSTAGVRAAGHAPTSPDGHAGEACLVILGLLIAVIVLAVRGGRTARPMFSPRRMRSRLLVCVRLLEPPCLYRLSIMRC